MTGESKTVLIAGAFGYGNTGDDAIHTCTIKELREQISGVRVIALSANPEETKQRYNIEALNWQDISQIIKAAESSDLMILGGGGLFYDYWGVDPDAILTPRHGEISFCVGYCLLATLLNKPLMIYAVGVGPLLSETGKLYTRLGFEQARAVTVRDPESRSLLESTGLDPDRVVVTADPAFRLEPADEQQVRQLLESEASIEIVSPVVGVALRNWNVGVAPEVWERETAAALDRFIQQNGGTVVFVPFHRPVEGSSLADDPEVARRVRGYMTQQERAVVLQNEYQPAELAGLIASCDLVLGMRLHSVIFAIKAGVPTVALSYDPKVSSSLARVGCSEYGMALESMTADKLAALLNEAYRNAPELQARLKRNAEEIQMLCEENAILAARLLNESAADSPPLSSHAIDTLKSLVLRQALRVDELQQAVDRLQVELRERDQAIPLMNTVMNTVMNPANNTQAADSQRIADVEVLLAKMARGQQNNVADAPGVSAEQEQVSQEIDAAALQPTDAYEQQSSGDSTQPSPADLGHYIEHAQHLAESSQAEEVIVHREHPDGKHKPRVAYLAYMLLDWRTREPRFGGGERYCLTLGTLLKELGFEVTFYQAAYERFEGDYHGFKVISIPFGESYSEFQVGISTAFHDLTADYDHVIYNIAEFASGPVRQDAILICHGIWFDHNNYPPPTSYRTSEWFAHLYRAFSQPRKVISVDTNVINVMRALWPELVERFTYVPNWVNTEAFHPPEQRDRSQVTVLFPRRSQINRGSRMLGAILEKVSHNCRIRWVGEGEDEESEIIKAVARRDPRLEFYAATFEQMPRFYQEADICVISTIGSEGTSLSCLEALASGCAIVSTNVGGLPNLIQPDVNGLLVDPQPGQIAAAIDRLIDNDEERAYYQQAGPRTAATFSQAIWQQRWTDLLVGLGWIAHRTAGAGQIKLS